MSESNMKSIVLTRAEALFLDDTLTVMTDRETMSGIAGIRPLEASAMMAPIFMAAPSKTAVLYVII